jgi:hypothetical protein
MRLDERNLGKRTPQICQPLRGHHKYAPLSKSTIVQHVTNSLM